MAERLAQDSARSMGDPLRRQTLDPTVIPAMLMAARNSSGPSHGFTVILTLVALVPAALLVALLWFGGFRSPGVPPEKTNSRQAAPKTDGQQAAAKADAQQVAPKTDNQLAAPKTDKQQASLRQQANAATAATTELSHQPSKTAAPEPPKIALTAQEKIEIVAGGEVPFPISIDSAGALPPRSVIAIRDIPEGASFSQGRPYGATEWNLRPDEIGDLRLRLPKGDLRAGNMRVELIAADGKVLDRATTTLALGEEPKEALIVRAEERDRVADLMAHGKKMIDVGYLAGARAYYKRAAEAGSADAALAVGATYDTVFIDAIGAHGTPPDLASAKIWYDRAKALGIQDAEAKLRALKEEWTPHETPAGTSKPMPPAPTAAPAEGIQAAAMSLGNLSEWVEVSENVNMRPGPSSDGTSKRIVPKGTKFRATGKEGNWIQVTDPDTSEVGWIFNRFLTQAEPPAQ
jgi:hypothetical protein